MIIRLEKRGYVTGIVSIKHTVIFSKQEVQKGAARVSSGEMNIRETMEKLKQL